MVKAVIELQKPPKKKSVKVTEQEIRSSVAASGGLTAAGNVTEKLKQKRQTIFTEASLDNSQKIEVLFNPSELHINAGGKLSKEKTGADKNKRNVDYGSYGTKMFNPQGIPVRAKVTIDISCTVDQNQIKAGNIYE